MSKSLPQQNDSTGERVVAFVVYLIGCSCWGLAVRHYHLAVAMMLAGNALLWLAFMAAIRRSA